MNTGKRFTEALTAMLKDLNRAPVIVAITVHERTEQAFLQGSCEALLCTNPVFITFPLHEFVRIVKQTLRCYIHISVIMNIRLKMVL